MLYVEEEVDRISIGICQIRQGYDFEDNLSRACSLIEKAFLEGSDMAVLPEMFFTPYEPASIRSSAYLADRAVDAFAELAARSGKYIVAGSMPMGGNGVRHFNRSLVFGPEGSTLYKHDKMHLFDCTAPGGPRVRESEVIMAGNTYGSFDTPWARASVIICYDIRFTPLLQLLADQGVLLVFVPAAFSLATGKAHWEMLVRMRSVEIQGFVIGVQPAYNPQLNYVPYGHSIIASPWGEILCDAGRDETVAVVKLDLNQAREIRRNFPLLAHRRKDLYMTSWRGRP